MRYSLSSLTVSAYPASRMSVRPGVNNMDELMEAVARFAQAAQVYGQPCVWFDRRVELSFCGVDDCIAECWNKRAICIHVNTPMIVYI